MKLGGTDVVSARLTRWVLVAACAAMPIDVRDMTARLRKDIVSVLKRVRGRSHNTAIENFTRLR
jgi:hypothetical protein